MPEEPLKTKADAICALRLKARGWSNENLRRVFKVGDKYIQKAFDDHTRRRDEKRAALAEPCLALAKKLGLTGRAEGALMGLQITTRKELIARLREVKKSYGVGKTTYAEILNSLGLGMLSSGFDLRFTVRTSSGNLQTTWVDSCDAINIMIWDANDRPLEWIADVYKTTPDEIRQIIDHINSGQAPEKDHPRSSDRILG